MMVRAIRTTTTTVAFDKYGGGGVQGSAQSIEARGREDQTRGGKSGGDRERDRGRRREAGGRSGSPPSAGNCGGELLQCCEELTDSLKP